MSGLPPDSRTCPFCSTRFSRVDGAKRHAKRCTQRNGRILPDRKRGRRAKACDQCSQVKVHCVSRDDGPCERCIPRMLDCTFTRSNVDLPTPNRSPKKHSQAHGKRHGRTALSLLLSLTDENQDFMTERAIGSEPDNSLLGPTSLSTSCEIASHGEIMDFMDPSILLLFDCETSNPALDLGHLCRPDDQRDFGVWNPTSSDDSVMSTRLESLAGDLAAHSCLRSRHQVSFDSNSFRFFLTVSNVRRFVATFCRKRHYRYPLIHWPTFNIEEASLPLLLVVALTGAAYTFGQDDGIQYAVAARAFYDIADSYVFDQIELLLKGSADEEHVESTIQLCEAALLMYALDILPTGDTIMQQTAVTKRLPTLISALRRLDFIQTRHDPSEDWQLYLRREKVIRIVAWTYCADCLATLSCNKPPGFSLLEMNGDLPCDADVWESESQTFIEQRQRCGSDTPRCLKDLMSRLLGGASKTSLEEITLPVFHLHIVLCGKMSSTI